MAYLRSHEDTLAFGASSKPQSASTTPKNAQETIRYLWATTLVVNDLSQATNPIVAIVMVTMAALSHESFRLESEPARSMQIAAGMKRIHHGTGLIGSVCTSGSP